MTTGKTIALTRWIFLGKEMSLLFNMLSKFVIDKLLDSSKEQMSFNFMATVTICSDFRVQEEEVCHCFYLSPFFLPRSDGSDDMTLVFLIFSFKPAFSLSSFTLIKFFSSSSLSAIRVVSSACWGCWCSFCQSWFQLITHTARHVSWCAPHIS